MTRSRTVLLAASVTGALALALAFAGPVARGVAAKPVATLRFAPDEGEQRAFHMRFETTGSARSLAFGGAGSGLGELTPFTFAFDGDLRWSVLNAAPASSAHARARVLVELSNVAVRADGPSAEISRAARLSNTRFVVSVSDLGRIERLETPSSYGIVERNVARSLASFLETPLKDAARVAEWSTEQSLPEATAKVRFEVRAVNGDDVTLAKTETVHDVSASALGASGGRVHDVDGTCTLHLDESSGAPRAIDCRRADARRLGASVIAQQTTTFALELVRREHLGAGALAALRAEIDGDAGAGASAMTATAIDARAELASLDRDDRERWAKAHGLDDLLGAMTKGSLDADAARTLDAHLAGRDGAAAAATIGRSLARLASTDAGFQTLASALARAGTESAQRALRDAATRPGIDARTQVMLTAHEGMAKSPTPMLEDAVRRAADHDGESRTTAELALGNMARTLRDEDPARANALANDITKRYADASRTDDRVHWLRALGNTGASSVTGTVAAAMGDTSDDVRRAAAQALRHVETKAACARLATAARTDPSPSVRAAAIDALPVALAATDVCDVTTILKPVLALERDESVVRAALEKLAAIASRDPNAIEALADYERSCGLASLCRTAKILLSTVRGS